MGFFSYKCAVSKQSIPAIHAAGAEAADCDMVLVTPKGAYRGIYDGYGRLRNPGIGLEYPDLPKDPDILQMRGEDINDVIDVFLTLGHDMFGSKTREEAFKHYDSLDQNMRFVKTKFYDPEKHTFYTLPASERCKDQGFFYGRFGAWNSPAYPKKAAAFTGEPRPINQIARDIFGAWGVENVHYSAKPYLMALQNVNNIRDKYINDSAESLILYFLGNAKTFKGEDAKRLKAELKAHLPKRAKP